MKKKITIEILETGEIKIDAEGFSGDACSIPLRDLEQALGSVTKKVGKVGHGHVRTRR